MLVVVAIVSILVSLLLPALIQARQNAVEVWCRSNMHQVALGFLVLAEDTHGCLPGNQFDGQSHTGDEIYKNDWLGVSVTEYGVIKDTPQRGTVFPYLGQNRDIYRCPNLEAGEIGSAKDSNGHFDYSAMLSLSGAATARLSLRSRIRFNAGEIMDDLRTPLLVEEDPAQYINFWSREGGHANWDLLAKNHRYGANIAAVDGSVTWLFAGIPVMAAYWQSWGPGNDWVGLGAYPVYFGDWNKGQIPPGWWSDP